jgi:hypothetical protein
MEFAGCKSERLTLGERRQCDEGRIKEGEILLCDGQIVDEQQTKETNNG